MIVSCSKLMAKVLSGTESAATIVALLTCLMVPTTLVPALFFWQTPTLEQLAMLALIGVFGFVLVFNEAGVRLIHEVIWELTG